MLRCWALALTLVALTVGVEVVDEISAEQGHPWPRAPPHPALRNPMHTPTADLASMAMIQEGSTAAAKVGGLYQYRPDGLNDVELSAIANLRMQKPDFEPEGLGESEDEVLQEFSTHKQHQPIKNLGKWGGTEVAATALSGPPCLESNLRCPVLAADVPEDD